MKPLQELSIGHRVAITVVIVLAILFLIAFIGWFLGGWEDVQAQAITVSKWESRLVELDKEALDQAYITQMGHVFSIWLKDGVSDPSRARVGFSNARKGYNAAMEAIEKREQQQ